MTLSHRGAKPRCGFAIKLNDIKTRCMNVAGHNGYHEGKGLEAFPYQRVKWFAGDAREYLTVKENEYAWEGRA